MLYKIGVLKILAKFMTKFLCTAALVLVRKGLVWPTANLLMFCRIECKSVFKVLTLSTEKQFSTDIALTSTHPMH